jgi:hypothetical protein
MLLRVPAGASPTIPIRDSRHGTGGPYKYRGVRVSLAGSSFLLDLEDPDAMTFLVMYLL